jgi:hypothetical protein
MEVAMKMVEKRRRRKRWNFRAITTPKVVSRSHP